jgi:hypothetical protein
VVVVVLMVVSAMYSTTYSTRMQFAVRSRGL